VLDSLSSLLLERAWILAVILVIAQFSLICLWSWRRGAASKRAVWIGFAAIPILLSMSALVVTTREQVVAVCHDLARYVEDGNAAAVIARLTDDFRADGMDRSQFEQRLTDAMVRHRIDHTRLSAFDVSLPAPDRAIAEFDASGLVRGDGLLMDRVLTRWRLSFRSEAGGWRLEGAETVPTPFFPIRRIESLFD